MDMQLEQLDLGRDLGLDAEHLPADDRRLTAWAARDEPPRRRFSRRNRVGGGVRFAFYGRVSTVEYQDAESSLGWQREGASEVIAGRGRIVAEFFDVGCSRRVPWAHRRQAAHLLQAVTSPGRGFDAIVVGESQWALSGTQSLRLAPILPDPRRADVATRD